VVERNGQRVALNITPTQQIEDGEVYGNLDFVADNGGYPVVVSVVTQDTPASEAGLQPADRIIGIDHEPVRSAGHVTEFVREHKTQPITLTVDRGGKHLDLTASVRRLADGSERLGFATKDDYPINRVGIGGATAHAFRTNVEYLRMTGKALRQVFAGKRSVRNTLSGPIGIYSAASKSIERFGWSGFWGMLTLLSLNLGIFNLLPIPVLDGGAIFLLLLEGALALVGMTLSTTVRERIQQVGFVVVVLIMVFAVTNDIIKRFSRPPDGSSRPPATAR
jgi:regulator of sigma E protease